MSSARIKTAGEKAPADSGEENRYLLVKHSQGWNCDRVSQWMLDNDMPCDWCYPADGEPLPPANRYAGVVSFGGAASANDGTTLPWVREETDFIETCLQHDVRFFGICLGAQMLARVLGAKVAPREPDLREVGFHRIDPAGDDTFLSEPMMMMQWHSEGFELPAGTRCSATGEMYPNQAFHLSESVFGVQFHPEVNPEALAFWHERNKTRPKGVLTEPERQEMMRDAIAYNESINVWLSDLLHRWTARTS